MVPAGMTDNAGTALNPADEADGGVTSSEDALGIPFPRLVALFVVSGAAGLVDQVCFSKYLSYIVGSTAYAVSTVLAAFMTGIALGAHFGGRLSTRIRRPLVAYGVLELFVCGAVALTPLAFDALTRLYAGIARTAPDSLALLTVLRWFVALSIVVLPTAAMGATLPVLTRALAARSGERERRLGVLYAANTAGGAAGALLGAYALLPLLGLRGTLIAAALASGVVGALSWLWGKRAELPLNVPSGAEEAVRIAPELGREPDRGDAAGLYALALASGALVFAAEVVFTHLLALLIGSSAYAFGLILAVFLGCLFVGAERASAFEARLGKAALAFGLAFTALSLTATLPVWERLPRLFALLGGSVTSFAGREAVRAGAAFVVLFVPTTLMGLTFPLLLRRVASVRHPSLWVGRLTAVNTLGAVGGALGTGYVVLPALGSERTLLAIAGAFALAALVAVRSVERARSFVALGLAFGTLILAAAMPRWDLARLTSGANVYFDEPPTPEHIPFLREDVHGGVTTVTLANGVYTLFTNGKFQGNTGWEMSAQRLFAHYPSLFVSRFDRTLVIGVGTGTTVGTLAAYPWKRIDVAEISPAIVDAARSFFTSANHGALDDQRVTLHHADGRNLVLVSDAHYDLIGMELSSIWFAGAASLYSQEFYELVRDRLAEGGVFQQWVQLHHVYRRDFATVVHTLRSVFPHVALFYGGGQGILVASMAPLRASERRLQALESLPSMAKVRPEGRRLVELVGDVLATGAGLDGFLDESARVAGIASDELISTDQSLYLEYATPRGNVLPWQTRDALVRDIVSFRDDRAIAGLVTP
jgi:spermidine synthase